MEYVFDNCFQIANAILCMDKNNEIPKDMVEQLLKYVPSQEETALLDEHSQKLDEMARADRYVLRSWVVDSLGTTARQCRSCLPTN